MATLPHPGRTLAREDPPAFECVVCGHGQPLGPPVVRADASRPFDLVRCDECGLVQQQPRWSSARITSLYDDEYYVFSEPEEHRWGRAVQQYVIHLAPLERAGSARGLRLLDLGCALGHLPALARRRGWRVTGLDVSPAAVSEAAVRFGLDVRAGSLARHRATLLPFDVAFLGDVIEHVPDPAAFIAGVRDVLVPGGRVCVDTPNWGGRWRRFGGASWLGINRFHINLFAADSLRRLLEGAGFREVRLASYTHYRYERWGDRPEVHGRLHWLPRFAAWRLQRFLLSRRGSGTWAAREIAALGSLDEALAALDRLLHGPSAPAAAGHLHGDNLAAAGLR
jgi:2-polyprenyl-3-methyl-5-hydroxy-6-metoxy-1,4-benzoquinol methylase